MLHILNLIWAYIYAHKDALLALVGGGAGLSVALQFLLHKTKIDSKKVAYTLIHLLSLLAALSDYILHLSGSQVSVLPVYAGLAIAAQTVHRFMVDPAYNKYVLPFLSWLAGQKAAPATSLATPEATPASSELA